MGKNARQFPNRSTRLEGGMVMKNYASGRMNVMSQFRDTIKEDTT